VERIRLAADGTLPVMRKPGRQADAAYFSMEQIARRHLEPCRKTPEDSGIPEQ